MFKESLILMFNGFKITKNQFLKHPLRAILEGCFCKEFHIIVYLSICIVILIKL